MRQVLLREQLALLDQVRGEEDGQHDLGGSPGWKLTGPMLHPDPRAVDLLDPIDRDERQQQQDRCRRRANVYR